MQTTLLTNGNKLIVSGETYYAVPPAPTEEIGAGKGAIETQVGSALRSLFEAFEVTSVTACDGTCTVKRGAGRDVSTNRSDTCAVNLRIMEVH
ncbi:hypothetical protein TRL7639_02678 [Falsiruegeria litorea R37]|uniref:Uncharacterized protein n=1 Tax=Falsiruegeria litorea R37 TaxID=1200284 RepID=A0A1Y5SU83_9RHOB|nr:hypothetical protein TRL7639_02678 [Falsiruegeria litorea R37]